MVMGCRIRALDRAAALKTSAGGLFPCLCLLELLNSGFGELSVVWRRGGRRGGALKSLLWDVVDQRLNLVSEPETRALVKEKIDRRVILGAEDYPEGETERTIGEAGLTRSRSDHIPAVSTPNVEVAPETKKTRPWRPYTKRTEPNRKTLEHYYLKQAEVKALDSGPFTETTSSKRLRHQNEEEARPRICLSPSRIVKNRGARAPITRRLRSHHVKS
ncbi:hypothetical protein F2Q69_00035598 [Brassica cretica]|uniref:Uncharacterized protein n=1 Tax=Brassica cretica TaxID=69181 RepID=A0A8S9SJA9_BRACR|nr:hypothetical protein F2Q69_00035598 [Brassica cretica]